MKTGTFLMFVVVCLTALSTLVSAGPYVSLSGGGALTDYCLTGPDGLKFAKGLTSLGGEIGYSYSYVLIGATYNYMFQNPGNYSESSTNVCQEPTSSALGNAKVSALGLRFGINCTPYTPCQFIIAASIDKVSSQLFYPGFADPVIDKTTVWGVESGFNFSLTPSFYLTQNSSRPSRQSSNGQKSSVDLGLFIRAKFLAPFGLGSPSGYQILGGLRLGF